MQNKPHFMQSDAWAKLKVDWKHEWITLPGEKGDAKASMLVLIRKVPLFPYTIMYAPRGFIGDPHDPEILRRLTEEVQKLGKKHHAYVFKIDPDVKNTETDFIETMKSLGYTSKDAKNFEGIQPRFVFRLDVGGKTEEEIFAGFHSKTRYNIRVAQKNGVEVTVGTRADLPRFHEIMLETGVRDNFVTRSLGYFERLYDCFGENCRLYVARHEGDVIAGTLAIHWGDKVWYLYGASSNTSRNVMPNYLLQWEMIRWSIETKCNIYDFRGVSGDLTPENPLYGLYRFKKGFGGDFTEFAGEFELLFKPFIAEMIHHSSQLYFKLRRGVFRAKHK